MKLDYIEKTYIEQGLSNDNYLLTLKNNKKVVYRIPKKHQLNFDYHHEYNVINLIKPLNLDVPLINFDVNTGEKITEYIENYRYFKNTSKKDLKDIATSLKKLHSLKTNANFNMFNKLIEYKGKQQTIFPFEEQIINHLKTIQKNDPLVLCHNDLVKGNLLFTNRLYLIDYEYASNNYLEFDLASLLSENNIESLKNIEYFLKCYYQKDYDLNKFKKVIYYYIFEDILWSYWALHFYNLYHQNIYLKIFKMKKKRAFYFYQTYIKKEG